MLRFHYTVGYYLVMNFLANFAAGLFICNFIPHLCSGLMGQSFPTPFAKPPGRGNSSALTNFLWGSSNLVVGCWLLYASPFALAPNPNSLIFLLGFLGMGVGLATHFSKVRGGKR